MIGLYEQIQAIEKIFKISGGIYGLLVFIPKTRKIILVEHKNDNEKCLFDMMLKEYCKEKNIKEFVTVTEAYMISTIENLPLKVPIDENPNRKEILMICIITKNGNQSAFAEITIEDKKRTLGGWTYYSKTEVETRYDKCLEY